MKPVLYESHMHTPLCNHADGMPGDYAAVAHERGLKGIIVTCHSPLPDGYSPGVRMKRDEWNRYQEIVAEAREAWAGKVDIRLGVESDFVPGLEPWLESLHASADLHHVLGSVHPHTREYKDRYLDTTDWPAFHRGYFTHLAEAAETGLFDTLSHPDLVKNYGIDEWNFPTLLPHIQRCLDRIAAAGTAMELNTSGVNKNVPEMNPSAAILREMNAREIPVVLGADAHEPGRVADGYLDAMDILEACGFTHVRIFLDRSPLDIPIDQAQSSLQF